MQLGRGTDYVGGHRRCRVNRRGVKGQQRVRLVGTIAAAAVFGTIVCVGGDRQARPSSAATAPTPATTPDGLCSVRRRQSRAVADAAAVATAPATAATAVRAARGSGNRCAGGPRRGCPLLPTPAAAAGTAGVLPRGGDGRGYHHPPRPHPCRWRGHKPGRHANGAATQQDAVTAPTTAHPPAADPEARARLVGGARRGGGPAGGR